MDDDQEPNSALETNDSSASGARLDTASERVEGPSDHAHLAPAADLGGPDSEQPDAPPQPASSPSDVIYVEPTIDATVSDEVELGVTRTPPDSPGSYSSVESVQLETGVIQTASEVVESPLEHAGVPAAADRDGPESSASLKAHLSAHSGPAVDAPAEEPAAGAGDLPLAASGGALKADSSPPNVDSAASGEGPNDDSSPPNADLATSGEGPNDGSSPPNADSATSGEGPNDSSPPNADSAAGGGSLKAESSPLSVYSAGSGGVLSTDSLPLNVDSTVSSGTLKADTSSRKLLPAASGNVQKSGSSLLGVAEAARSLAASTLQESLPELGAESLLKAFSGKVQLVHVPTALLQATDSEARAMMGLPEPPVEPTLLERIWRESVQFYDVRSILSQIWARDETVFHSLLSEIWASPAMRAVLSEIWEDAVEKVEPKSVLSEIWAEPPVHVDIRSVLSQIWSEDNKQRIMSILSEIWSTPAMRSVLSEIWGSDALRSILSEIWSTPVEMVDIRSILSQIWSTDNDEPPPHSILSEIWASPAVQSVLSEIWGSPKLRSVLSEIWKEPVHKVDIRSVLSQIWSSDNDEHVRSILSEIWASPAVRSVLSQIWHADECAPVTDTHADYRVTESEILLEELIDNLQKSVPDVTEESQPAVEPPVVPIDASEERSYRVERYKAASEDADLPASRPLTTRWAFGGSCRAPVLSLSNERSKCIVYGAAQSAVIYDFENNTQRILQGHRNCVCGLAASPNGRWIATGDIGPDNALIVWDAAAGAPLQMHFPEAAFSGPLSLAFSCDARYVFGLWGSVSGADGSAPVRARQQLLVWDWTIDHAEPKVLHQFGVGHGFHEHLAVSQWEPAVVVTTAACRVIFFQMTDGPLEHHCPQLQNRYSAEFKCNPGNFSQTAFSTEEPYSAVTGTSKGYVILWSDRRPSAPCDPERLTPSVRKEARKVLKINESPITCLRIVDGAICAGTADGQIRFLDEQLRLMQWYQDFELAAVRCLSFHLTAPRGARRNSAASRATLDTGGPAGESGPYPADCSLEAAEFIARDIVVTTTDGFCGLVHIHSSSCSKIAQFPVVTVRAVDVHMTKPHVVIGAYDGSVSVYDYERRQLVDETTLPGSNRVHSVAFSPSGLHLAVGMQSGELAVLDGLTLRPEGERITLSRDAITQCLFSPDSDLLATRDDDLVVSVYRLTTDGQQWATLGRYRAHHKPVVDLVFAPGQGEAAPPRLLSLGEDRVLVEYDLVNSTKENPVVLCCDTLEQSGIPLCMVLYPPLTAENFILIANSQYKMKLFNAHTRMCRRVVLGPQYGSPVERIKVIPRFLSCDAGPKQEQHSYLAFSTSGLLGLQILPLDGNPRRAATVIGHPNKVEQMACSADGRWLFTSGGEDGCVFMWEVYPESLETMSLLGGSGMTPFYDQLPGGKEGELYQQLEDLVYYTELVCQGEDLLDERQVSQRVPLHCVTDILRAIGFFPAEKEVEDMINEVRYREYAETGQLVEEVNLDDIIQLYLNHRPVVAVSADQLAWALQTLGQGGRYQHSGGASRKELLRALQSKGEHMSEKELAGVLAELLDPAADTLPQGVPLDTVEHQLPRALTMPSLCRDLLGMPELLSQETAGASSWSSPADSDVYKSASPQ
ncbi:cilia- and flagella-associated protein 251-like [Pollicipes pollicipes]|uniref:cilia- and flagella-associated protein 251-like n=1 Tax=Pollicipes pollicipes TaxID=41117 RepID=UPI0018858572|nr:cilia- and flagella-associated protein 251-like [Pollicipes pollicipes]